MRAVEPRGMGAMEEATTSGQAAADPSPAPQPELPVRCRACQHAVARTRDAVEKRGSHEHTFRNPAGYSFHVLCFSDAPGCLRAGEPTPEATWFPGHPWCFALCEDCHGHLGWWYLGDPGDSFVGLIATRLIRPSQ